MDNTIPTEQENIAFQHAYSKYLNGATISNEVKEFDRKYGADKGIQLRIEAVEIERFMGENRGPHLEDKRSELERIFRKSTMEEKETALSHEYFHRIEKEKTTPEVTNHIREESKEAIKEAYKQFVLDHYDGKNPTLANELAEFDETKGKEQGAALRMEAMREIINDASVHPSMAEFAQDVHQELAQAKEKGPNTMKLLLEQEKNGEIGKQQVEEVMHTKGR